MQIVYIPDSAMQVKLFLFAEVVIPQLTVHWQKNYYSVSEADGSVEVCAELSTLQFEGNVQVNYATFDGSAEGNRFNPIRVDRLPAKHITSFAYFA